MVEVKYKGGDLERALTQAAAHVFTFRKLNAQNPGRLVDVINGMIAQKADVGLLQEPKFVQNIRLVPVVAAPEEEDGWIDAWKRVFKSNELLQRLQVWRLSEVGEVLECVGFSGD